jgi:hypothetical protein
VLISIEKNVRVLEFIDRSWVLSRLSSRLWIVGQSADNLAVKVIDRTVDQLGDDVSLLVGFVELTLHDVSLIKRDVQMALDLLAGSQGYIKEPTLVLKRIPTMGLGNVAHRRNHSILDLPAESPITVKRWLASQPVNYLHQFPGLLPALQVLEPFDLHALVFFRANFQTPELPGIWMHVIG